MATSLSAANERSARGLARVVTLPALYEHQVEWADSGNDKEIAIAARAIEVSLGINVVHTCKENTQNEYLQMCEVCGLSGSVIHRERCDSSDITETENNIFECNKCGFTYFEQMYTTCGHCNEMVIPIEDDAFDGTCSACGKDAYAEGVEPVRVA